MAALQSPNQPLAYAGHSLGSSAAMNPPIAAVVDPSVDMKEKPFYVALKGAETVSWREYQASAVSNSQITVAAFPPNRGLIVSRRIYLKSQITLTFAAVGPPPVGPLLQLGVNDGLRSFPLSRCITAMNVSIGDATFSAANYNQYWPQIVSSYHNGRDSRDTHYSPTPSMPDTFQEYNDWTVYGSARNPLAFHGENAAEEPRGGYVFDSVTNVAGAGVATVVVTLIEPVFLSPMLFDQKSCGPGFAQIDTINCQFSLGNLSRLWSHNSIGGNAIAAPTVTVNNGSILLQYYEPDKTKGIPRELTYPYYSLQSYTIDLGSSVAAWTGATPTPCTLTSQSIQTKGVPKRFYVWVGERFQDQNFTTSDSNFRIEQCTVTWDTKDFMSGASQEQLYNIASKNGANYSWPSWRQYRGSMLCIDMALDVGLPPEQVPGAQGAHQLTVKVQSSNVNKVRAISPTLNLVIVYEGLVAFMEGKVQPIESPVTPLQALNARTSPGLSFRKSEDIYGGGFWSDFGNAFVGAAKKAIDIGTSVVPHLAAAKGVYQGIRGLAGGARSGGAGSGGRARRRMLGRGPRVMRGAGLAEAAPSYEDENPYSDLEDELSEDDGNLSDDPLEAARR